MDQGIALDITLLQELRIWSIFGAVGVLCFSQKMKKKCYVDVLQILYALQKDLEHFSNCLTLKI